MDLIRAGAVDLVINTPFGRGPRSDGSFIRTASAAVGVPCITTLPGVFAAVRGIEALRGEPTEPRSIQEHHAAVAAGPPRDGCRSRRRQLADGDRRDADMKRVRAEILSTRAARRLSIADARRARDRRACAAGSVRRRRRCRRTGSSCCAGTRDPPGVAARGLGGHAGVRASIRSPDRARVAVANAKAHGFLDVIGPLGQGVRLSEAADELPVGRGRTFGAAPLYFLAQELARARQARRHGDRRRRRSTRCSSRSRRSACPRSSRS